MKWGVALGLLLGLGSQVGVARAEITAEERAVAVDLFQQATTAEESGKWAECERALGEAVKLAETPGLRFHLAYCKEQQRRWVEALVDYRRAQELLRQGALAPDVEELLPEAISKLDGQLPRLTLRLGSLPEAATLYIDGTERSTALFGKAMPLDPGNRRIEVIAPGYEAFSSAVTLLPRERRTLDIVLTAEAVEAPAVAAPLAAPREPRKEPPLLGARGWVLISEAAVSLVTLGIGITYSVDAAQRDHDRATIAGEIDDPRGCAGDDPDRRCGLLLDATRDANQAQKYATAAYVTSGVAAGAFVATWLLWPSPEAVSLRAGVAANGWGLSLGGKF